jgi:hypothetical protein
VEANVYGGVPGFGSSVNTAVGPKLASTGVNSSGGPGNPVWASPGNVGSTSFYTTAGFATSAGSGGTGYNYASFFGFTIPLSFAVVGVNVIGVAFSDASAGFVGLQLQLLKNGQPVGTPKVVPIGSSAAAFNAGGNGDLWGIPGGLLASDVNQSNFGVAVAGVYQASYSSGVHTWSVNSVNVVIFAQDPSNINPWVGSGTMLSGIFSLPYGGGMQIAAWTASSVGVIQTIQDVRPSGITSMPVVNGFQEQVTDSPTLMRTLDNSFHIRADLLQPTGKIFVGGGQIKLPNSIVVTWNGAGPPNYFYLGPFVRSGVIAGQSAVTGRPGLSDAVKGIVQLFIDQTGAVTWNDAPAYPAPETSFASNYFPLAVAYIDSAARINNIVDARPAQ